MSQPHVSRADLEHRFGYHRATFPRGYDPEFSAPLRSFYGAPDEDGNVATAPLHAEVRALFIEIAEKLVDITGPPSREQALMLTALQEAAMWANADIAMSAPLVKE